MTEADPFGFIVQGLMKKVAESKAERDGQRDGMVEVGVVVKPCGPQGTHRIERVEEIMAGPIRENEYISSVPETRRQYINIPQGHLDPFNPVKSFGRKIRLRAKIAWTDPRHDGESLAGITVHFKAQSILANEQQLQHTEKSGFDAAGSQITQKNVTTNTLDGWTPPVDFFLSTYGGDQYRLFVTLQARAFDGTDGGTYTVWRRLWYKVTEMKNGSGGKFTLPDSAALALDHAYHPVFIDFEEVLPRCETEHVPNLTGPAERKELARPHFIPDHHSPFICHIFVIDWSINTSHVDEITIERTLTEASWVSPEYYKLWTFATGTHPWKAMATHNRGGAEQDIADDVLTALPHPDRTGIMRVMLDFGLSGLNVSVDSPLNIQLRLNVLRGGAFYGWGGGSPYVAICKGALAAWEGPNMEAVLQRVLVHELGHSLGLVNLPPFTQLADWEETATDHGKHCNQSLQDCVMNWAVSIHSELGFHGQATLISERRECHDHLRRIDLSRNTMDYHWTRDNAFDIFA